MSSTGGRPAAVPTQQTVPAQRRTGLDAPGAPPEPATAITPEERARLAKERRAARKAARAAAPPPERDAVYDSLSLGDLRGLRSELGDEETRVSYWRRIIQARLDVVRSHLPEGTPVADLTRVLSDARSSVGRLAHLDVRPVDDIPPLPDLAEVWARQVDRSDELAMARLEEDLADAEEELSDYRRELHRRIDLVTDELIARYREQPLLALQILPDDPLRRTMGA
ncbi:MAG: hypothetical protein GC157_15315 [Frankiales bacterium]|nr:hypothetical protein [Frankiales bacterium]